MQHAWQLLETEKNTLLELRNQGIHPILARCLMHRGLDDPSAIETFLHPEHYQPPEPSLMPELDRAVKRIGLALKRNELICIYGDYDADGVSSIAILKSAIAALGGRVFYYIPDRFFEGVGLHCDRLQKLKDEGVGLVITVDTGSQAFEEMDFASKIGLDVIITDHHTPDEMRPGAFAVLNPKLPGSSYPFKGLCGAGVAWKLVQGLDKTFRQRINLNQCVKVAAIATIADMVPLKEENRWIVWHGLRAIETEERGPIRALLKRVGVRGPVQSSDISFRVAPRINAPGRLGDPELAIALLDDPRPREIPQIIEVIEGMNSVRQMIERDLTDRLESQVQSILAKDLPPFVLLAGRNWHRGILGIMACKMLRRLERPVCVLSYGQTEAHGSLRSLRGINLMKPLKDLAPLLTSYGGHPEAAGVSLPITNIPQFKIRMCELLDGPVTEVTRANRAIVDAVLDWSDIGSELFKTIQLLAPFGIGNPAPVFQSNNLILESNLMFKGPWCHFEISDGSKSRRCNAYVPQGFEFDFERFDSVDVLYMLTPYRDGFQIQIVEMKPSAD